MRLLSLLICCVLAHAGFSQTDFNMELVANVDINEGGNDIWGYVDEATGIEYAIMGGVASTRVFSLEDHSNPVQIANIPGTMTTWRDIKTWRDKAYVVCDNCPDGLLIIDMADPTNITWEFKSIVLNETDSIYHQASHNIFIDENGYAYLAGGNYVDGVIILDLNVDPSNPTVVGFEDFYYAHDVYVRGDTMWTSDIYEGEFSAYDVTDKGNPIYLGGAETSSDFTHNAWLSDDGNYLFTTDERGNAYVDAYDVSDLTNIKRLDLFQPLETVGQGVVPHNTHYKDGYLVTSWYSDGVVITDANRPSNMVKVGSYDTYFEDQLGTRGCWGAYPWLPSGHIIASDRYTGLYVLRPTYQRACYLEGTVSNVITEQRVFDAQIVATQDPLLFDSTDPTGAFATGRAEPGNITVEVTHPNYYPRTVDAVLENGVVTFLDIDLLPREEVTVSISTVDRASGDPVPNVDIYIFRDQTEVVTKTNANGDTLSTVFAGEFKVVASAWGYLNTTRDIIFDGTNLVLEMDRGYEDTFVSDQNWTVSGDAATGIWERAKPLGTISDGEEIAPSKDYKYDAANFAYVTGNGGGNPWDDDIDGGTTVITSDLMDLSWYADPVIHFASWFRNEAGNDTPNDNMRVSITNGDQTILLYETTTSEEGWKYVSNIPISSLLEINEKMQLVVQSSDLIGSGHWVEAGFDAFLVTDGTISSEEEIEQTIDFSYFPNPAKHEFILQWSQEPCQMKLFDISGKLVQSRNIQTGLNSVPVNNLDAGYYTIQLITQNKVSIAKKLLKVD